ncbi:hypothetical protein [Streptomyces sp. NPDC088261]|uniref:hypothetical protein n=1 Tax=Streptomyces sp. NPDC088261 TaxID=3365851 RepID=UPI0037FBF532
MNEYLSRAEFLDGKRDRGQSRADEWKRDEQMEQLAALAESRPEIFEKMGVTVRLSLGYYQNDKANAAAHGRDVSKGGK